MARHPTRKPEPVPDIPQPTAESIPTRPSNNPNKQAATLIKQTPGNFPPPKHIDPKNIPPQEQITKLYY